MDHTYQTTLLMPASYAVLSEEEMTYVEGGAFSTNIDMKTVMFYAANFAINSLYVLGRGAFQQTVTMFQNGFADGMSAIGIADHFWNSLNGWSKAATVGLGALGGYYVYTQVVSIVRSIKNLVEALRPNQSTDSSADTAAADPTAQATAALTAA